MPCFTPRSALSSSPLVARPALLSALCADRYEQPFALSCSALCPACPLPGLRHFLPYTLHRTALPCLAVPCRALPYLPCFALLYSTLSYSVTLRPYPALSYPAQPHALPCLALPCPETLKHGTLAHNVTVLT